MRRRDNTAVASQPCIERFLDQEQWQALVAAIKAMPRQTQRHRQHYERARFLLSLLYLLGPRVSEIASHTMGSFVKIRRCWWWWVVGKGQRPARVPVNQDMLAALSRYRLFYGLTPLPDPAEKTPLIMNLSGTRGITDNMIYRIVKDIAASAATLLRPENPTQAALLTRISTHWLRHTSITHQADAGVELRYLQRNARHAKLDTTGLYLHAGEDAWHTAMERHGLDWK
jgi:site-specific recombinase XerD